MFKTPLILFLILSFITLTTGIHVASCTKEVTIHDTVNVIKKDTVTVVDTLTVVDSSCASCYDLKEGLIAYYNFNGGNTNDSSGNNNNITFNNAVKTTDRFGNADNAYLFDGSSSYMSVPNSSTLNPQKISIMAIIKVNDFYAGNCHGNSIVTKGAPDNIPGFMALRFSDTDPNRCNGIPLDPSKEVFQASLGSSAIMGDSAFIKYNQWINVVYTYDGFTNNLYINGELKFTSQLSSINPGNTSALLIGKNDNPLYPYWFNGVIDEIRIYNRELCAGEVKLLNQLKN